MRPGSKGSICQNTKGASPSKGSWLLSVVSYLLTRRDNALSGREGHLMNTSMVHVCQDRSPQALCGPTIIGACLLVRGGSTIAPQPRWSQIAECPRKPRTGAMARNAKAPLIAGAFFVRGPIGSALLLVGLLAAGGAFGAAFTGSLSGGGALGDLQCGFALGVQSGTAILWHVVVFVVCACANMATAVGARKLDGHGPVLCGGELTPGDLRWSFFPSC